MGNYVVAEPVVCHADGGWRLIPRDMSGHELADFIRSYFPELSITSTRDYVALDQNAQLVWQDTGKPYMHDVTEESPYRVGFYVAANGSLLADEFYEDWPMRPVVQED